LKNSFLQVGSIVSLGGLTTIMDSGRINIGRTTIPLGHAGNSPDEDRGAGRGSGGEGGGLRDAADSAAGPSLPAPADARVPAT
jgi:hypothetical protein